MPAILEEKNKIFLIIKEAVISLFIVVVLFTMDRCLENMYCFFLYDTGKRYLDLFMSLYLHSHRWMVFIIPSLFIIWLVTQKFKVNYGLLLPISAVYAVYLITSLVTCGYTYRWSNMTLYPMMMYLFVTMMCSTEQNAKRLFRIGTDLYTILLLFNALFTLFPSLYNLFTSWKPDFFISADNLTGFPLFLGLLFSMLDREFNNNKTRFYIYLFLFILNLFIIHCLSSLLAAFCFSLFYIPFFKEKFKKKNIMFFVGISISVCIVLVFIAWLNFYSEKVYDFLDPILDYVLSLYIRFIIWNGVIALCMKAPVLGYGLGEWAEFFDRPNTVLSYNAHNCYLQTLYEGGIVTILSVLFVFYRLSVKLSSSNCEKIKYLISAFIFSELIMMQASITSWFTWYPVFFIAQIGALSCSLKGSKENEIIK